MNMMKRYDIIQRLCALIDVMDDILLDIPTKDEDPLCDNVKFCDLKFIHEIAGEYINMVMNREYEEE